MTESELKQDSAPIIEDDTKHFSEFIKERGIEAIVFDLDGTLLNTPQYYKDAQNQCAQLLEELINGNGHKCPEDIKTEFPKTVYEIFKLSGFAPVLIETLLYETTKYYLTKKEIILETENLVEYKQTLNKTYGDFYKHSPEIYPGTLEVLHELSKLDKKIAIHTHAQSEWSEIKVKHIKQKYFEKYNTYLNIEFIHSVEINKEKNSQQWSEVANRLELEPHQVLAVGDNFNSDILESLKAGYTTVIYLYHKYKNKDEMKPEEVSDNSILMITRSIESLFNPETIRKQ